MSLVPTNGNIAQKVTCLPSPKEISTINPMDRRVATRLPLVLPVSLQVEDGKSRPARTINISATGARLISNHLITRGTRLKLTLDLPEYTVELTGKTVWEERLGEFGTQVVGVAFEEVDTPSQVQFREWLQTDAA
jgi:PilZ domain